MKKLGIEILTLYENKKFFLLFKDGWKKWTNYSHGVLEVLQDGFGF